MTVLSLLKQSLACINQVRHESLIERRGELSGLRALQNLSSITVQHKHPFSYDAETSLIITVFHRLRCPHFNHCDKEEAGAGQWLSLSAHSGPVVCSVWGTDNFHQAD